MTPNAAAERRQRSEPTAGILAARNRHVQRWFLTADVKLS
jgi:hypothetical protein